MYKKALLLITLVVSLLTFHSCSKTENGAVEFIPFQESEDGQWGMISLDGQVLFTDEFKTKPTVVRDGRFFVRTKEGIWEMYDASEKPKKIGADYAHTSGFRNGVALVAEKGKPVSIIDPDGKTIKILDKIEGKVVDGVRTFSGEYALFMTADSLWGAIDQSGKCVVKPEYYSLNDYADGKFIGVNAKYKDSVKKDKRDKVKISVIEANGKVKFEFSASKYENIRPQFSDGLLAVSIKKDGKEIWGIINDKGEIVVKPSTKIKNIGSIQNETFTYYNGEGWGLMNTKGETLIRAKYEWLYYDQDNILVAVVKDGDSFVYKYIDEKDQQITDETYVSATPFSMFDGEHALVQPNDKIYSIIEKSGKQVEGLPDMVNVSTSEGETYIESDYIDLHKLLAAFNISPNGVLNVTTSSTPQQVVKLSVEQGMAYGTKENPAGSPYWYDYRSDVNLSKDAEGVHGAINITFTGKLSRQTYKTKRVIDYTFYDYYWYHDEKIPLGYVWNNVKPSVFSLSVDNSGRMRGKLRNLYKILSEKFKKMGKIAKENNSAVVVELNNGERAVVFMQKESVGATWGNLIPANEIDIDQYKDATEEGSEDSISYGYLNNLFPDRGHTEVDDSVAVDSAYADSAAVY